MDPWRCEISLENLESNLKATFWLVAMACGFFQVVQAMTNGSAVRSGIGPIWVGAMSATISTVSLLLVALLLYRLPLPDQTLIVTHGWKVVAGGMMGGFIVTGLAFVAPRLGPTQTFTLYFVVIAVSSTLIDCLGLLGTEAKPLEPRQLFGVLIAGVGLILARS
jgi:bacterial/archaeal transporter family-2 protein